MEYRCNLTQWHDLARLGDKSDVANRFETQSLTLDRSCNDRNRLCTISKLCYVCSSQESLHRLLDLLGC